MAQSRLTMTLTRQLLDSIAKVVQTVAAAVDGGPFTGEGSNTMLYGLRYQLETRLQAWASDDAIAKVVPPLSALLNQFNCTDASGAIKILARHYGPIIAGLMAHHETYDDTYSDFWAYWAANKATTPNHKVLGEVARLMNAYGLRVDPAYCAAPANLQIGRITFTGASAATITPVDSIDPLLFTADTVEVYCVGRHASPDEVVLTINNAKISTDGPATDGTTDFPITILNSQLATNVADVAAVDSDTIYDLTGATLTITSGGKLGDDFILRAKALRAPSF